PDQRQLRAHLAAGTKKCARTRGTNLSLRLHLASIWHRSALAAHSPRRCPVAARLSTALVATVESAAHFHLVHCGRLVGKLSDRGNDGSSLGPLCLVRG